MKLKNPVVVVEDDGCCEYICSSVSHNIVDDTLVLIMMLPQIVNLV